MTRNQKLLIGLAGAGVLAYLLFKGSKAKAQTTPTGTTDVKSSKLPQKIKDGAVIEGKKYSIKGQADCPDGYAFGIAQPEPCTPGRICDSGGPRCTKMLGGALSTGAKRMCPEGQMPCPDDGGCFDPNVTYIRNPCDRSTFPAFKNIKPVFDSPQGPVPFGAEPMSQI